MSQDQANAVLVIEDSKVQAKIISKQVLALTNFSTQVARTMTEASHALENNSKEFFAAVVDLNLPDAPDGEAVDLVLGYDVPAVVLTASFNDEIRQQFIKKKVADYFFKGTIKDMDPMVTSLERLSRNRFIKVLVVDDMKTDRTIIKKLLHIQRYQVLEAANGVQALETFADNPDISIVITDYQMPEMDGFELTKALREERKKDSLAVIGVSSAQSGPLTAQFLKNGANDFINKPFEVEEFTWRVNRTAEMLEIVAELKACQEQL